MQATISTTARRRGYSTCSKYIDSIKDGLTKQELIEFCEKHIAGLLSSGFTRELEDIARTDKNYWKLDMFEEADYVAGFLKALEDAIR